MSSEHAQFPTEKRTDRRSHPRRTVDLLANRFVEGQPSLWRVLDLSETGMRGKPLDPRAASARYGGLQFQLPDVPVVLTASAEALEGQPSSGEIRLRFTVLTEEARRHLAQFVARSSRPSSGFAPSPE